MIDYGSVCSGIESVTVAVHPLGWKASWFAEIEDFPSRVLSHGSSVRRLMPHECEQLQGFPVNYTRIPLRFYKARKISELRPADMWDEVDGGWMLMAADGPRYKAIGNSKATTVVRWIARRIDAQVRILEHANDNNPATTARQVG